MRDCHLIHRNLRNTGKRDKNNIPVYEGDVLRSRLDNLFPENVTVETVIWLNNRFLLVQDGCEPDEIFDGDIEMSEVIENVICKEHPVIRDIINSIDENGPVKTMMSGSGPSIFAIFEKKDEAENVADKLKSEYSNIEIYVTELL